MADADLTATLAGWRETEQAATPGPWTACGIGDDEVWSEEPWGHVAETMGNQADAGFIATSRTAMPRLLAAVDAVLKLPVEWRRESEALRDAAGKVWEDTPDAPGVRLKHAYAAGYAECAKSLEAVITRELTKEGGDGS